MFGGFGGTYDLEESNEGKNLILGRIGDGVPCFWGVRDSGERRTVHLHRPGEVDAIGVNDITDECKHGNTSVLDFRLTKETDGLFRSGIPEVLLGKTNRVEVTKDWVALLRQHGQILGSFHGHVCLGSRSLSDSGAIEAGRSEGGGRASDERGKKEFHCRDRCLRSLVLECKFVIGLVTLMALCFRSKDTLERSGRQVQRKGGPQGYNNYRSNLFQLSLPLTRL